LQQEGFNFVEYGQIYLVGDALGFLNVERVREDQQQGFLFIGSIY